MSGEGSKKNKVIKWSSGDITTFLECFQNYELLWNVRHVNYTDKPKRETAMKKLHEDLLQQNIAVADISFLRSKIKSIKATYRQEFLKVAESKTSGKGTDDVYEPKLAWYNVADSFLREVVITRTSTSNLKVDEGSSLDNTFPHEDDTLLQEDQIMSPENAETTAASESPATIGNNFARPQCVQKKRRIGKINKLDQALTKLQKISEDRKNFTLASSSTKPMDEYDMFAQHVAAQMRQLPVRTFILLQEKIQRLITEERLNTLQPTSPMLSDMTNSPMVSEPSPTYDDFNDDNHSQSLLHEGTKVYTQLF